MLPAKQTVDFRRCRSGCGESEVVARRMCKALEMDFQYLGGSLETLWVINSSFGNDRQEAPGVKLEARQRVRRRR